MADHTSHAKEFIEAFNEAHWDKAADIIGTSTYSEFGTQRSLKGQDTLDAFQGWKTAMPDVRGTAKTVLSDGDRVMIEVTWHGTHTGPLATPDGEIPASGKTHTTPAVMVFDYDGDALTECRHYFDMLTFLQQIGAA